MEAAALSSGRGLNPSAPEFHPRTSSLSATAAAAPPLPLPFPPLPPPPQPPPPPPIFPVRPQAPPLNPYFYLPHPLSPFRANYNPTTTTYTYDPFISQPHLHVPLPPPTTPMTSLSTTASLPLIDQPLHFTPTNPTHTTTGTPPLPPPPPPKLPEAFAEENRRSHTPPRQGRARVLVNKWLCKGGFENKRTPKSNNNNKKSRSRSKGDHDQYCGGGETSYYAGTCSSSSGSKHKNIGSVFLNYSDKMMAKKKNQNREKCPPIPVRKDGGQTTVMIRNIPNQYSREELVQFLDDFCRRVNENNQIDADEKEISQSRAAFDFLYLPIDFRTLANRGFAFVNFTDPETVWKLHLYNSGDQSWDKYSSDKRRDIACAKVQGKGALVEHFEKSVFVCGSDDFLPVCFSPPRDGSGSEVAAKTIGKRADWRDLFNQ